MKYTLTLKENPKAEVAILRNLIGYKTSRRAVVPVFNGRRLMGTKISDEMVTSFHVVGFGSTLEKAERMALQFHLKHNK